MRGRLRTPGKQRSAHTEKAGTGSGGQPARGSRLEGTRITSSLTGKHATSRMHSHKVTSQKKKENETAFAKDAVLRMGWHLTNGSPVKRGGQLHIGLWFTTSQRAPTPQVPGQGFLHFWLLHASF
jgi:hypothetical protein